MTAEKLVVGNKPMDSLKGLSPRELDIYGQLFKGKSSAQIAGYLSLSIKTVANYTSQI